MVERVESHMSRHGTNIMMGVLPQSISKTPEGVRNVCTYVGNDRKSVMLWFVGRLQVTFSTGDSDTFDTVISAVGTHCVSRSNSNGAHPFACVCL